MGGGWLVGLDWPELGGLRTGARGRGREGAALEGPNESLAKKFSHEEHPLVRM